MLMVMVMLLVQLRLLMLVRLLLLVLVLLLMLVLARRATTRSLAFGLGCNLGRDLALGRSLNRRPEPCLSVTLRHVGVLRVRTLVDAFAVIVAVPVPVSAGILHERTRAGGIRAGSVDNININSVVSAGHADRTAAHRKSVSTSSPPPGPSRSLFESDRTPHFSVHREYGGGGGGGWWVGWWW